jgi:general secretion pathway protein C
MLSVLYSFYKPIYLILFVLFGLACGHLIDTVLQMKLRPAITPETAMSQSVVITPQKDTDADLNLILQNNIFDPNSRSATATMTHESNSGGGGEAAVAEPHVDLKLFGTVVAGKRSQVLLEANKVMKLYHLGDKVPGDGIIEEILRNQAKIRNPDKTLTTLVMDEKSPLSAGGKPSRVGHRRSSEEEAGSTDVTPPKAEIKSDSNGDVKQVGENRWQISRGLGESVRENFAAQMRLVQMQPRVVDGKTNGFMVNRINPQSVLAKMGLQAGDVVVDVNNTKLDSPEKALQVFQQLREAHQISVSVERNNQPLSFSYEIE